MDLLQIAAERESVLLQLAEREKTAMAQLSEARAAADRYERGLLTSSGDELVECVLKCFEELGFSVVDADRHASPGDKLEDLRVTDHDAESWTCLVEVKGYEKGAKTEAISQFLRFQRRFSSENGRMAEAEWYVANQFRRRDPGSRQPVLHGSEGDVKAFGDGGGLIIDTTVLFQLLMAVREGLPAREAREHLRSSTGMLVMPLVGK